MWKILSSLTIKFNETKFDDSGNCSDAIDRPADSAENSNVRDQLFDVFARIHVDMFLVVYAMVGSNAKEKFQVRRYIGTRCINVCLFWYVLIITRCLL